MDQLLLTLRGSRTSLAANLPVREFAHCGMTDAPERRAPANRPTSALDGTDSTFLPNSDRSTKTIFPLAALLAKEDSLR